MKRTGENHSKSEGTKIFGAKETFSKLNVQFWFNILKEIKTIILILFLAVKTYMRESGVIQTNKMLQAFII